MNDDAELLRRYAEEGSEAAFQELVRRYADLVYSAALRRVGNDTHLAQDVAQAVFAVLARKARGLPSHVVLAGWLYRHACLVAAQMVRTECRRRVREAEAAEMNAPDAQTQPEWEQLAPFLEQMMERLGTTDRDAIVLRYFQRHELRSVGAALGVSEEAARKRVTRALERLRTQFQRRGLTISLSALAAVIGARAVAATPASLASGICGSAHAAVAARMEPAVGLLKIVTGAKVKFGCMALILAAGIAALIWQRQNLERLKDENARLASQLSHLQALFDQNKRMSEGIKGELANAQAADRELLRLRGQVALLRREAAAKFSASALVEEVLTKPLPRASWANIGTATPEAAVETFFWALQGWQRTPDHLGPFPGLGSIVVDGDLENAGLFMDRLGALLVGDPLRMSSLQLAPAHSLTNDTTQVAFTLTIDDGTKQSGEITVTRAAEGWAVELHGRGRGDAVEVSFASLTQEPAER